MRRILAALAAATLLLTACGSDDTESDPGSTDGTAAAEVAPTDPVTPVEGTPGVDLPEVTGAFGEVPEFTFPDDPPAELTRAVLVEGDGEEVSADDIQLVNYVGIKWGAGEAFNDSYASGAPVFFELAGLIPGWRDGVTGLHEGDRVVISIPSELGYGPSGGNADIDIAVGDTLVFVVDILNSRSLDNYIGEATDSAGELPEGVTLSADPGTAAVPVIADGTDEPSEIEFVVISEGTGEPITEDSVVVAGYSGSTWANEPMGTSWPTAEWGDVDSTGRVSYPMALQIGSGTPFDRIIGVPVGSRVLFIFPSDSSTDPETPAQAVLTDVVAAH